MKKNVIDLFVEFFLFTAVCMFCLSLSLGINNMISEDNEIVYNEGLSKIETNDRSDNVRQEDESLVETEKIDLSNIVVYKNEEWGIEFKYPKNVYEDDLSVEQSGNTFEILSDTYKQNGFRGQFVEVYKKDKSDTLKEAIEKEFLQDFSKDECFVSGTTEMRENYSFSEDIVIMDPIDYPIDNVAGRMESMASSKCPHRAINGARFFYMDKKHPDSFAYFSIGQYRITLDDDTSWEETFRFIY